MLAAYGRLYGLYNLGMEGYMICDSPLSRPCGLCLFDAQGYMDDLSCISKAMWLASVLRGRRCGLHKLDIAICIVGLSCV